MKGSERLWGDTGWQSTGFAGCIDTGTDLDAVDLAGGESEAESEE